MRSVDERFLDWVPIRFYMRESEPFVDWCYMATERFTHPFFSDNIRQCMRRPFNLLFRHQTPIDLLSELKRSGKIIPPTGFIFHMSRCGSTLVGQMLAASESNIVISEAAPVDSIISLKDPSVTDDIRGNWLRWMMDAFGRQRHETERRLFVKFDSWSTLELEVIKQIFPDVPWIFLYRNPVEVIVSHMRQRGSQMVPGTLTDILPGVTLAETLEMPPEEYCAKILARICTAALQHDDDENGLMVNYDQLPEALTGVIAEHFSISFTQDELDKINDAAKFNAKTPQMFFEPDSAGKQTEASSSARHAAAKWVEPLYKELEAKRSRR